MRTRLSSFATAALLAATLFASSAGTALMATQTTRFCVTGDGNMFAAYVWDDVTHNLTAVQLTNNEPTSGTISGSIVNPSTNTTIWQGAATVNTGLTTWNIPTGQQPTLIQNSKGQWVIPYTVNCSLSA